MKYTITEKPNIKQHLKYKVDDPNDIVDAQIIDRAGKTSGKNKNWYNIKSFKTSQSGKSKFLVTFPNRKDILMNLYSCDRYWKHVEEVRIIKIIKKVYESIEYNNQKLISLRWVHSSKIVDSNKKIKERGVAKRYQEENNIKSDSYS